jgi:ABC-type bacteriocin/lantibiotic exporter with double-glycine peptidase domain
MTSDAVEPTSWRWRRDGAGKQPLTLPEGLFRYVAVTSWVHQVPLVALTVTVFLLEVVPLELQRRVVNDVVKTRQYSTVVLLCAIYVGAVILQGGTKLGLNIYRAWVGERATRDLRRRVCASIEATGAASALAEDQGTAVSMLVAEVESVGGFIGSSVSEPLMQIGVLATVVAYIIHLDVWMGAAALALFAPQFVFVPLMQHAMNRRTGARVWLLRQIGAGVIAGGHDHGVHHPVDAVRIDRVFHLNMRIFQLKFTMNFLMNLCSHLQIITALLLGGSRVLQGDLEIGGVIAFISGVGRLNDPWGDLVNYFRDVSVTRVKFDLLTSAVQRFARNP